MLGPKKDRQLASLLAKKMAPEKDFQSVEMKAPYLERKSVEMKAPYLVRKKATLKDWQWVA